MASALAVQCVGLESAFTVRGSDSTFSEVKDFVYTLFSCLHNVCMFALCVPGVCRGQKKALNLLEPKLWAVVSHCVRDKSWVEKGGSVVRNSRSYKGPTLMLCTQGGRKKIKKKFVVFSLYI